MPLSTLFMLKDLVTPGIKSKVLKYMSLKTAVILSLQINEQTH